MNYDLCLHIDSNDPAMLRLVLKNAANYIKGLPGEKFQLAVVANGPAVILFTDEHADLRELAAPLLAQGVRVMRLTGDAKVISIAPTDKEDSAEADSPEAN